MHKEKVSELKRRLLEAYSILEEVVNELSDEEGVVMDGDDGGHGDVGDITTSPKPVRWRDVLGFHVNPVVGDHGNIRAVYKSELKQAADIASWAVMNFNRDWWCSSDSMRDDMVGAAETAHDLGLKLIIRLEDPDVVRPYNKRRVDPKWWESRWRPYVEDVCRRLKGKVYTYQVMNEVWCKGSEVIWGHGGAPSAEEYIKFLGMSRARILAMDSSVKVLNAGITTVTEKRYWDYVQPLLDAGWLEESDGVNVHLYWNAPRDHTGHLHQLSRMTGNAPLYVTEANHLYRHASHGAKFDVIRGIAEEARRYFDDRLQCVCAFCANYSDHLKGWEILGKSLYDLLARWSEEEIV